MSTHPKSVTDFLSHFNDQLFQAAKLVGNSKIRQAIFKCVYSGKRTVKTIKEISAAIGKTQTHVLVEGGKMAGLLFEKVPDGYKKHKEFSVHYKAILNLATNKKKRESIPTQVSPKINLAGLNIKIPFPKSAMNAKFIAVEDIDSFSEVKKCPNMGNKLTLGEKKIKAGFKRIIGEKGTFKDWAGEKSDLFSTRIVLNGKRIPAAIAFKGKGTSGKLVPSKMGKNGDQINRLFEEPANLFIVVYGGQIESSIMAQMKACAISRAISGQKIYYCIVDGSDLLKIKSAYPKYF